MKNRPREFIATTKVLCNRYAHTIGLTFSGTLYFATILTLKRSLALVALGAPTPRCLEHSTDWRDGRLCRSAR